MAPTACRTRPCERCWLCCCCPCLRCCGVSACLPAKPACCTCLHVLSRCPSLTFARPCSHPCPSPQFVSGLLNFLTALREASHPTLAPRTQPNCGNPRARGQPWPPALGFARGAAARLAGLATQWPRPAHWRRPRASEPLSLCTAIARSAPSMVFLSSWLGTVPPSGGVRCPPSFLRRLSNE